jgi:hypothetical protein
MNERSVLLVFALAASCCSCSTDGFGDPDLDGYLGDIDCGPDDPDVFPGADEVCGDGIDQDCDGQDEDCLVLPNIPPLITIESPVIPRSGEPISVMESTETTITVVVSDEEDDESTLVIHWLAERTDEVSPAVDLGDSQPDTSGYSNRVVAGLEPGLWLITAQVEDSGNATDEAELQLEVISTNLPPQVMITQPADGDVFAPGSVVTFVGAVSDDEDAPESLFIEWFDSIDGVLDTTSASGTGLLAFSRDDLALGDHLLTLTVTDGEGLTSIASVAYRVVE